MDNNIVLDWMSPPVFNRNLFHLSALDSTSLMLNLKCPFLFFPHLDNYSRNKSSGIPSFLNTNTFSLGEFCWASPGRWVRYLIPEVAPQMLCWMSVQGKAGKKIQDGYLEPEGILFRELIPKKPPMVEEAGPGSWNNFTQDAGTCTNTTDHW